MKKFYLSLLLASFASAGFAQGLGIGTNTPDPSALLHLNSTTKGVLIPSMTGAQRQALASPAEGLIVYDLSAKRTFQYQDGAWRLFITNDYWAQSGSRNWVYNGTDSVGIGNAAPADRLHVSGNIRSTGDLRVLGDAAVGLLTPEAALHIRSATASQGMLLDATNPIIQFRQNESGTFTNKGFVQLTGDNLRIGTNSGNTTGSFVIRNNGGDRVTVDAVGNMGVGTNTPDAKLDVNGNVNFNGKLTTTATGAAPMTPYCYGTVDGQGNIVSGSNNFTVTRDQVGWYTISSPGMNLDLVIFASGFGSNVHASVASGVNGARVFLRDLNNNNPIDARFSFLIYKPL